jgi:hypothetical protein
MHSPTAAKAREQPQRERFEQFRKIETYGGDPVLFAMLNGMIEQTIRCRHLDVANTFRETFVRNVYKLKVEAEKVQDEYNRVIELFDQALEGRLTLDQAREALSDLQSTDIMQELFIEDNRDKTWIIEKLHDGIPVDRNDEVVIPWFCKTFGIEICIYWLEGHGEYERIEFLSPRVGMIVNIYQIQNEFETETGLLYFPNYDEAVQEPRYPNCCLASDLSRWVTKCSTNKSLIPRRSNPSQFMTVQSNSFQTSYPGEPLYPYYRGDIEIETIEDKLPPQAEARLKTNFQEQDCTPNSGKQLMLEPLLRGVVPKTGISIAASEEQSKKPAVPLRINPLSTPPQQFKSHNKSVEREFLGISSVAMGTSSPLSQGQPIKAFIKSSYLPVQPSQTVKLLPLPKLVKAQVTKTSDPVVTRSLPPARVRIVPKNICSACKTGIIGLSYECSPRCKVCIQCLVRSALPAKTCPGCRQINLSDEAVETVNILKKLRPN